MTGSGFEVAEFASKPGSLRQSCRVGTDHAITASLPVNGGRSGRIVTRNKLRGMP